MGRVPAPKAKETTRQEKEIVLKKEAWPPFLNGPPLFFGKKKRH
jgi:hypothetical protein